MLIILDQGWSTAEPAVSCALEYLASKTAQTRAGLQRCHKLMGVAVVEALQTSNLPSCLDLDALVFDEEGQLHLVGGLASRD
jgi:hypothetical protein